MSIPTVKLYASHMPKYGGPPKPVALKLASVAERRVPPTRRTRQPIRNPILKRKSVAPVVQPPTTPVPAPAAPPPARNILPQRVVTTRPEHKRQPHRQPVNGRSVRPVHNDTIARVHVNKIRELKQVGQNKILAVIACGPSINEIPLEQLVGHPRIDIMSINKPDKRIWPTTYWAFCDMSQYTRNKDLWDAYNGIIINSSAIKVGHRKQIQVRTRSGQGFARDLTNGYYIGRSTTYANMQTALWMGYERVYIFGCDMGEVNGQMHFYGHNPDVSDTNRAQRFAREAEHYQFAATTLPEADRKKFYFCSSYNKWQFVKAFNQLDHKLAIPEILEFAANIVKT